jgi:hypothetical protein
MFNKRKGQSTVEYIVLVTAVIGVTIAFLLSPASPFRQTLTNSMNNMTKQIGNMTDRLTDSTEASDPADTPITDDVKTPVDESKCIDGQTFNPDKNKCE